jgi:hypothetical protein
LKGGFLVSTQLIEKRYKVEFDITVGMRDVGELGEIPYLPGSDSPEFVAQQRRLQSAILINEKAIREIFLMAAYNALELNIDRIFPGGERHSLVAAVNSLGEDDRMFFLNPEGNDINWGTAGPAVQDCVSATIETYHVMEKVFSGRARTQSG